MALRPGTIAAFRSSVPHLSRPRAARGFTLVEMMVVVVLTGILAVAGVVLFRKHVSAAHGVEAASGIQAIRSAEEQWKGENLTYLNVSGVLSDYYPPVVNNTRRPFNAAAPDRDQWDQLRPSIKGQTQFGFAVVAGGYGDPLPSLAITDVDDPWVVNSAAAEPFYIIKARALTNGTEQIYVGTSFSSEIYSKVGN